MFCISCSYILVNEINRVGALRIITIQKINEAHHFASALNVRWNRWWCCLINRVEIGSLRLINKIQCWLNILIIIFVLFIKVQSVIDGWSICIGSWGHYFLIWFSFGWTYLNLHNNTCKLVRQIPIWKRSLCTVS